MQLALACLFVSLAALVKLPFLFVLLVLAVIAWRGGCVIRRWASLGIVGVVALGACFAWYRHAAQGVTVVPARFTDLAQWMALGAQLADPKFWSTQFVSRFPELCTTYAGLLFLVVGLRRCWRGRQFVMLGWFAAVVIYTILLGYYGRQHQYTALPFVPVNALLIGFGLDGLLASRPRGWRKALLVVLVASIPLHAALRIKHWYRLHADWLPRAAAEVAALSEREDLFVVSSVHIPFYLYHIERRGWSHLTPCRETDYRWAKEYRERGAKFLLVPRAEAALLPCKLEQGLGARYPLLAEDEGYLIFSLRTETPAAIR